MKSKLKSNSSFTILVGVVSLLLAVVGITAAYFSITVTGNDQASSITATTVNLGNITFTDGNEINAFDIYPGWSATKTFTVANTKDGANDQISYAILLYEETNTITYDAEGAFLYSLSGTSTNGGTTVSITEHPVPDAEGEVYVISDDGLLYGEDTHTYTFTIMLNETGMDQNAIQGKSFKGIIQIDVSTITGYRTWDSVSGTWKPYLVDAPEECFEFNSSTGEITAYNYSNPECPLAFAIPEEINGEPVTEIADYAFYGGVKPLAFYNESEDINIENGVYYNNKINISNMASEGGGESSIPKLIKVKMPDTVTTIGNYAFAKNYINELILPSSLTTIGDYAFASNILTTLTIPSSVTSIGDYAFKSNLISGELDLSNLNNLTIFSEGVFALNSIDTLKLPTSTINIGALGEEYGPFDGNTITSVNFEDLVNLQQIGDYAFFENSLNSISFEDLVNLQQIGDYAFCGNSLDSVNFSSNTQLATIREGAFSTNVIETVTIPSSVATIEDYAFVDNILTSVCIKGKSSSAAFTMYGIDLWSWSEGYSDSNITWNCTN